MRVNTFLFMPFKSRAGELVVGAQFGYDKRAIEALKLAMREARKQRSAPSVGGWLEGPKCWFFERDAWPLVVEEWSKLWPIEIYEGPILVGITHYSLMTAGPIHETPTDTPTKMPANAPEPQTLPPWLDVRDLGDDDEFTPITRRYER